MYMHILYFIDLFKKRPFRIHTHMIQMFPKGLALLYIYTSYFFSIRNKWALLIDAHVFYIIESHIHVQCTYDVPDYSPSNATISYISFRFHMKFKKNSVFIWGLIPVPSGLECCAQAVVATRSSIYNAFSHK